MLPASPNGPQRGVPKRLSELAPSPGRQANADGTRVGDIHVTHSSSYPTLRARSVVVERRPGSSTTITKTHKERLRGGHMTGGFTGGSLKELQKPRQTQYSFSEY